MGGLVAHRSRTLIILAALLALLAASCGRSGFQYIENEETGLFAKIPDEWEITSEGLVDFVIVGSDGEIALLPGDRILPWRTDFDASPADDLDLDGVLGTIEIQPVDRRLRSEITVDSLIGLDSAGQILAREPVERGDFTGLRITYETEMSGRDALVDRMMLHDDRFSAVYELRLFCNEACFAENAAVIDEIMATFTVEAN